MLRYTEAFRGCYRGEVGHSGNRTRGRKVPGTRREPHKAVERSASLSGNGMVLPCLPLGCPCVWRLGWASPELGEGPTSPVDMGHRLNLGWRRY